MKKIYLILAAAVGMTITSCTTNDYLGEVDPNAQAASDGAIRFGYKVQGTTRAGELIGDAAAAKLGNMFVVEGTKGTEATDAPTSTVVFDNYLVGYTYNSAATTESNTNNWEYVGKQTGITGRMSAATWTALHGTGTAQAQSIKYWDYSVPRYDFIAWSTGTCEAVADAAASGKVKVTRINTGTTLATNGFTLTAYNVDDLMQCYYTDINTVLKADYNKPVTLTFRNMATKVRVALYETIPGYSVKDVKFYEADDDTPATPDDLGATSAAATLFTTGTDALPRSGSVLVYYPHIGSGNNTLADYDKASVTVTSTGGSGATSTTQTFGTLTAQYGAAEAHEASGDIYLGRTLPAATFAGDVTKDFYTAVFPNSTGYPLTLRVDYTLVSTDGSGETIKVYGAKAVVPATYTEWQPNYAYTYIFKISDNSNGWTSTLSSDPKGLFPITFDAVVTNFVDVNAEQTTVTTVATPSITTYQQGHTNETNEYSKSQTAGVSSDVKKLYVQVMDNTSTPSLVATLANTNSLLFAVSKANATEAEVMDALKNHAADYAYNAASPVGRNGITLTASDKINNSATSIVNGVDDQPITGITAGKLAEIDIASLSAGTYAYVYCTTVPTEDEVVYNVASVTSDVEAANYYEVAPGSLTATSDATAQANKVYFVANLDAQNNIVSYTFKQTKVGDSVTGLYEATIDLTGDTPASTATSYTPGNFYFDVYKRNNGAYAVKVIKVV